jgi:hypothetical protein
MIWRQENLVTALASRAESKLGFDDNKEKTNWEIALLGDRTSAEPEEDRIIGDVLC